MKPPAATSLHLWRTLLCTVHSLKCSWGVGTCMLKESKLQIPKERKKAPRQVPEWRSPWEDKKQEV